MFQYVLYISLRVSETKLNVGSSMQKMVFFNKVNMACKVFDVLQANLKDQRIEKKTKQITAFPKFLIG